MRRIPIVLFVFAILLAPDGKSDELGTSPVSVQGRFNVKWIAKGTGSEEADVVQRQSLGNVVGIHFFGHYILLKTNGGGGRVIGAEQIVDLEWTPQSNPSGSRESLPDQPAAEDVGLMTDQSAQQDSTTPQPNREQVLPLMRWVTVDDFEEPIAQFQTVFWDPRDTISIRQLIRESDLVKDKTILEIGTGTGLLSLCCLKAGAAKVVATDVNPWAIGNAAYNAASLGLKNQLETRLVPRERPTAYPVIAESERFDLIISNPPWEDRKPGNYAAYAYYDESFGLLRTLLADLRKHLTPGGKALLAYGFVGAIKKIQQLAPQHDLTVRLLDDRNLDELPAEFLPGMLIEVAPKQ